MKKMWASFEIKKREREQMMKGEFYIYGRKREKKIIYKYGAKSFPRL